MEIGSRLRHWTPVLAVGIIGISVSLTAGYLRFVSESATLTREFAGRASNQAVILQSGIEDYWDKLYAIRALFNSSDRAISRDQFESFAHSLLDKNSAVLNIAWIPKVKREERAAHELAAARDGLINYSIRDIAPGGDLPRSPERDEYFPKFYSTEARSSPIYGINLEDGGTRERTLDHIRDDNVLSISAPLMLLTGQGNRFGFWAAVPVYARGLPHETVEDRRRNLLGFAQGVFQIGVILDTKLSTVKTPVHLYIFSPDATANDLSIYAQSRLGTGSVEAKSQAELGAGLHSSFPIHFGDVEWRMVVVPEHAGFISGHLPSSTALAFGLLLTGVFTSFIWAVRRAGAKFEKQNSQFDAALNNMAQGLLMYDSAGGLVTSNRRVAELFDVRWEQWKSCTLGMTIAQTMQFVAESTHVTESDPAQVLAEHQRIVASRRTGTVLFERTDGRTFSAFCAPMQDGGFVITFDDITERRRTDSQISHLAHYDALTDLPNRILFYNKMDDLLAGKAQTRTFAILTLDLDDFKGINDTLGHPIGDKLLQAAAERMRSCIRDSDMVARLGGDEFAVVQVTFGLPPDASALASRLIEKVGAPYQIDGHQVVVGISVGIAIAPDDGANPDQLIKNADMALYRAKADGGRRYQFFKPKMDALRQETRALELDLRNALVNGEFTLNYQPIVNLKSGKIVACEALIRWNQPERGWVPPLEFIPIAEKTGLIVSIGEWVLNQACADAAEWPNDLTVAVNVSPAQFKTTDFFGFVTAALAKSRLPAGRLELEITELILMQDNNAALALLHQLKELGVCIAMDDFGTGYSSLGYLRSFPFDRIKIDQSFIGGLSKGDDNLAIIRAVVGLGHSLGFVTTAEGVETQQQLEVLKAEGCTEAQGYLISRPIIVSELREFFANFDVARTADSVTG